MQEISMQTKLAIQSLRGAQPVIVLSFLIIQRAMTIDEIQEVTGLHNDTIRRALKGLQGKGLEMQRGAHGRQVWLLASETLFFHNFQSPKFSDSATTTTTNRKKNLLLEDVVVVAGQNPKFSDSENKRLTAKERYELKKAREEKQAQEDRELAEIIELDGIPFSENMKTCRLYGIGEPMASEISMLKHVTPEYIAAHVKSLMPGETKGLAIVRIRAGEEPRMTLEEIEQESNQEKITFDEYL